MSVGVNTEHSLTQSIFTHGTFSPNTYAVSIRMPGKFIGTKIGFDASLAPRIQRITLPEREISVIDQKSAYRESRSIPKGYSSFGNLSMSILLSEDLREKKTLMMWQDYIINPKHNLNPSYVDSIIGTIKVVTLANPEQGKERGIIHRFYGCYPINVGDVELSYATTDEAGTLDTTFTYSYFTLDAGSEFKDDVKSITGTDRLGDVLVNR